MNMIYDEIARRIPNFKRTPSGWHRFNGVCCVHNRQTRPDTKGRAGIRMDGDMFVYHCFNCNYVATWHPPMLLSQKTRNLLSWFGVDHETIKKLNFKAWQYQQMALANQEMPVFEPRSRIAFNEGHDIPADAMPLTWWAEQDLEDPNFAQVCEYLWSRGERIFNGYEYYWSPTEEHNLNKHLIIPATWNGKVIGWTARACYNAKVRYYKDLPENCLFGIDQLFDPNQEWILLMEGPFDAIAVGGMATFGNTLNAIQCDWLNQSKKKIIVVPDQGKNGRPVDDSGQSLIDVALKNGWYVSIPSWGDNIKDCADAVKQHGKLFTVWQIMNSATNEPMRINLLRKMRMS